MSVPFFSVDALVLREVRYKEADRILTLLTSDRGKLTAKARGALRRASRIGAATQQLTYSEFTVFENRGMLTINEAVVKEPFEGLRKDFTAYSLGCYFAEAAEALSRDDYPEPQILQLTLNCLYALSNSMYSAEHIRSAFELRLSSILGYQPDLSGCAICGKENPEHPVIGLETGRLCCRECRNAEIGVTDYLTQDSVVAMRHIVSALPKQILSYHLEETSRPFMSAACEDYLSTHASRRFRTLEYYKNVIY